VHGFLGIPAILRALYELNIAYNIILYNTLDVCQQPIIIAVMYILVTHSKNTQIIQGNSY
jgi:hypothetical protein